MNAFIEHKTGEFTIFVIDPEKVSSMIVREGDVMIYTNNMMFGFGQGSINGTREDGLEIMQKILDWRNAQFDRAEKLKNLLAEDPFEEPLPKLRVGK